MISSVRGRKETILNHIVILRVLAIFLVVLGHATRNMDTPNLHLYYPEYTSWIEVYIKQYIYSFHMPLFFWISGYIFYFSYNKINNNFFIFKELKKKIKRLIIPLYATSFLVLLPTMLIFGDLDIPTWKQILFMFQMKANDHLWFLEALFLIFLIAIPFAKYLYKFNNITLIIVILLMMLVHINIVFPISTVNIIFKYLPYFLLGFMTRKIEIEMTIKTSLMMGGILFVLHFINFNILSYFKLFENGYLVYMIAIVGIYTYYFLSVYLSKMKFPLQVWEKIKIIDNSSYSIYLFHVTFLYIVLYINYYFSIENSWFRIIGTIVLGILLPIYIQQYFSKNKYSAFLFSMKYRKDD